MGFGLIVLKKELDGEEFSNTYAFNGTDGTTNLGAPDLFAVGADVEITDANTSTDPGPVAAFFLHRVIAFDRMLTHISVNYTEVYITDGTRNETDPGNTFFTAALDFLGLWSSAAPVPGNVTLLVQRVPAGFNARKGRLYLRAALDESEIRLGGRRMLTWQTPGTRTTVINRVNAAVAASGLTNHMADGFGGNFPQFVIPHYEEVALPDDKTGRNLVGGTQIARLTAAQPNARQVQAGRKEKKG